MLKEKPIMFLENDLLKLRPIEPEDLESLYKWENDTSLWIHGNTLSPYSKMTLRQYIIDTQSQDIYQSKQLRLMIDLNQTGETIGTVDIYDFDVRNLRAGIGILIDEKFRKNDYAFQSLEIVKEYVFSFLHFHQLYAYVLIGNTSSIKLFTKSGFEKCGTLKQWVRKDNSYEDVHLFQFLSKKKDE